MRAQNNSPEASQEPVEYKFDEIYEQYFEYVYRLVARLAGANEAEDLCQDVFVVVHRRLDAFEGRSALKTWLFQIAYRVAGASIRKRRMRRLLALNVGAQPLPVAVRLPQSMERAEEAAALANALAKLSWKKRSVLILHEVEDWPCVLIAERLEIPINTVYTRLRSARRDLASCLAKEVKQ